MELNKGHLGAIDNTLAALNKATFNDFRLEECQAMMQAISRLLDIKEYIKAEIEKPKDEPKKKRARKPKVESIG